MVGLSGSETNIKAVITAEDKASSVLKGFGDKVGDVGSAVEKGLKVAAVGIAAAGAAATAFGIVSVKAFSESEDLIAQTNAVLKSTGGIAGVTADQVTKLSSALEKQTKFSDEDVRSVENLLLTFTAINKDIFPQATKTVLDMAQALGEDTKSASIQLGKALQDPILGVTALRRVGVNFSSAQQDVIKNLVNTGQSAKAQQMILKELNTEFGGSAVAAGKTLSGALTRLKNQFNNVEEGIGGLIAAGLEPVTEKFLTWFDSIGGAEGALRHLNDFFSPIVSSIIDMANKVGNYLAPKLDGLWSSIQQNIIPALTDLWHNVLEPLMPVIGTLLVAAIGLAIDAVHIITDSFGWLYKQLKDGNPIIWTIAGAFGGLALAMGLNSVFSALTAGFAILTTVTIPGAMGAIGALKVLIGTPLVMPAIIIIAALAAMQTVANKFVDLINQINDNEAKIKQDKADTAQIIQIGKDYKAGKINAATRDKLLNIYARAGGGDVNPGQMYAVGDNPDGSWNSTTELFVPNQSGTIINAKQAQGMAGGGGNGHVNIVVNIGLYAGSEMEKRSIAVELLKAAQDAASAKSTTVGAILGMA